MKVCVLEQHGTNIKKLKKICKIAVKRRTTHDMMGV